MVKTSKSDCRKILILHDDVDEYLAKALLSYLDSVPGFVFLKRNARWGCDPSLYLHVIRLNDVDCLEDSNLNRSNVWEVKTQNYLESSTLSKKEHYKKQAKAAAESLKSRF